MTVPVWPTDLPRPERDTWGAEQQDARQRRQNDAGPPGFRRRFSKAAKKVSLSVQLSRDLKAVFDRFFDEDTKGGSLPFWMPDPTTDGWYLLTSSGERLLISGGVNDGKPLLIAALWLCSFGEQMPRETVVGREFRISFSLVVYP